MHDENGLVVVVVIDCWFKCMICLSPAVPYQQGSVGGEKSSGPIRCQRCREVCKGEVVRVQDTHFHVKCFTCTGRCSKHTQKEQLKKRILDNYVCLFTIDLHTNTNTHTHTYTR